MCLASGGSAAREACFHGPPAVVGPPSVEVETTVKTHVARILAKLGGRDRVQAVVVAYETGFARRRGT